MYEDGGLKDQRASLEQRIESAESERDRYKFNADELRKSRKRQAERYQRTIAEHIDRAESAEKRVKELEAEIKDMHRNHSGSWDR